ncbi:TPA: type IV secretory system conjugative DNA transfer family protein [Legionella pneumophila]|nr:TraM recognition domain-containing protein [Legionella pneumophila]HAU9810071.1 type IV secretory system conjugative DNA transfer family protein [Legionella pneumophila]HAU9905606.1 type IV secretory system conjugative DNA transfer family protein [Legionella pneumophila]HAU9927052.1 type IV secretory system conjugative DNA transfer family protein [Legionella pneumophila]HAU9930808.1 type IV secretory system conjugative DNA transfer family protein [Legionella pneumophila]
MRQHNQYKSAPKGWSHRALKSKSIPLLVVASFAAGLQAATQYLASLFDYQDALGTSWNHIYLPWSIVTWWQQGYVLYPQQFTTAGSLGAMLTAVGLIGCAMLMRVAQNSSTINAHLHGSARWANRKDIIESGLLGSDEGVYVGAWEDKNGQLHYLRHNGPEHILTYAPTRSGKGLGLVLPTLLSWPHSALITDLKGELWAMTAGWRKNHANNKVIRFEPASLNGSARWNPLDEIRIGTEYEVGDVQNLATLIVDPDGKGLESHWQKTSQALLVGLILHALYKLKNEGIPAHFPNIDRMLADPNLSIPELLNEMTQYAHQKGMNHPVIHAAARDMIDRPEEEAGSVLSTLKSYLSLYRDPVVAQNVSASDFSIKDLMNHDQPVSLYIVTQPNDKARLQPLVRVLINMSVRLLADKMEFERFLPETSLWQRFLVRCTLRPESSHTVRTKKTYKHRLLGMIDEFPSLGKLDILQESLAFVAGYGIKFYLICQDINQLKSRERGYGPDETITSNCHIQNAFPPNRLETAEHLSKLTGLTTVIKEQITTSGRRAGLMLSQVSRTIAEVQRPLLTADECLRLPGPKKNSMGLIEQAGDMVVYMAGFPMIYGKQPLYFKDPVFTARAALAPPAISDTLRHSLSTNEEIHL